MGVAIRRREPDEANEILSRRDLTPEQNERLRSCVRELRSTYKNQEELGKAIGVSQGAISAFLKGKQGLSIVVARRVVRLLNLPLSDILGDDPEDRNEPPIVDTLPNRARLRRTDLWAGLPAQVQQELLSIDFRRVADKPFYWWIGEVSRRLELFESGAVDADLEPADPEGKR